MLGVFAEFETNLRKERQAAGIAKAKAERPEAYQGKPASVDGTAICNLLDSGMKPTDVAKKLNVSRATVTDIRSLFMTESKLEESKFCTKCDGLIKPVDKFCSTCGVKVQDTDSVTLDALVIDEQSTTDMESKFEKIHAKFLDDALSVETKGKYYGKWKYDKNSCFFVKESSRSSGKFLYSEIVITSKFPTSDILSIDRLSETKNLSGISKGALAGALVAGPLGALAGGAYAGSKNSLFVDITLKNQNNIFGHVSNRTYEHILMNIDSNKNDQRFLGIKDDESGGEYEGGWPLWLVVGSFILWAIVEISS